MIETLSEQSAAFNKLLKEITINPQEGLMLFHEKYQTNIKSAVRNVTGNLDLLKEVENDIYIKLWIKASFISKIKNPASWIYVVVANCIKDKIKTTKVYSELHENISCDKNYLQEFIDDTSFYGKIAVLPELEQDIIIKKLMWCYTFKEISEINNMPESTASSIYYRAIKKLKKKYLKNI